MSTHTLTNGSHVNNFQKQHNLINSSQITNNSIYVPQVKSKDTTEYSGYFEWKPEDDPKIIARLIDGMKYLLFYLFRYFMFTF